MYVCVRVRVGVRVCVCLCACVRVCVGRAVGGAVCVYVTCVHLDEKELIEVLCSCQPGRLLSKIRGSDNILICLASYRKCAAYHPIPSGNYLGGD